MILAFKTKFPDGTTTDFVNKILNGSKIHTLRQGERWQAGYFVHYGSRTAGCIYTTGCGKGVQGCKAGNNHRQWFC